tara:strand:+ start:437 stop:985 length:549 start_codon:yes stop_codon:yes gene_type:complete
MPGKAKYCEHCKGYGSLFVQVIKRFGDDRIKERYPENPAKEPCEPCKGTGMISIETDKVPVFDVDEQASAKITTRAIEDNVVYDIEKDEKLKAHVETDQEYADRVAEDPGADIDVPSEAPEPTEEDGEVLYKEQQEDEEAEQEDEEVIDVIDEEEALDEKPVDADDPVIFQETPVEGDEMSL